MVRKAASGFLLGMVAFFIGVAIVGMGQKVPPKAPNLVLAYPQPGTPGYDATMNGDASTSPCESAKVVKVWLAQKANYRKLGQPDNAYWVKCSDGRKVMTWSR